MTQLDMPTSADVLKAAREMYQGYGRQVGLSQSRLTPLQRSPERPCLFLQVLKYRRSGVQIS